VSGLAIEHHASPNHGERAAGKSVDMLILHYTGMASEERAFRWLCDPESGVSAHYFVGEDGRVTRMVEEGRRAWHAGKSMWAGESDINSRSIGIEIANPGHEFGYRLFPDRQVDAVVALCRDILARHAIPACQVLAHSDVAPARKADPGELFPWKRLAGEGIGVWVEPEPPGPGPEHRHGDTGQPVERLRRDLAAYGYGIGPGAEYDEACVSVVRAFQRHFRPLLFDGVADGSTMRTLARLLATVA
jgi:N-acetylmuramoyl-L-alanine amidase